MRKVKIWLFLTCLVLLALYLVCLIAIQLVARRAEVHSDGIERGPVVAIVFYDDDPRWRKARVAYAVDRLLHGAVEHIVMTGGSRPGRNGYRGSQEMVEDAIALGAPAHLLHYDAGSNDTVSNLREGFRIATELNAGGVELISDRMHLGRIMLLSAAHCRGEIACRFRIAPVRVSYCEWFERMHHEIAAYLSWLLPRSWVEAWLVHQRHVIIHHRGAGVPA